MNPLGMENNKWYIIWIYQGFFNLPYNMIIFNHSKSFRNSPYFIVNIRNLVQENTLLVTLAEGSEHHTIYKGLNIINSYQILSQFYPVPEILKMITVAVLCTRNIVNQTHISTEDRLLHNGYNNGKHSNSLLNDIFGYLEYSLSLFFYIYIFKEQI